MIRPRLSAFARRAAALLMVAGLSTVALAQDRTSPATLIAAQREAMLRLAFMDGVWRGPAWTILPSGEKHSITQTERIGPMLDGSVKVIEGRGYGPDGKVTFNAFATISFDVATKVYTMHSNAMGRVGDFVVTPTPDASRGKFRLDRRRSAIAPSSRMARGTRLATASCPASRPCVFST